MNPTLMAYPSDDFASSVDGASLGAIIGRATAEICRDWRGADAAIHALADLGARTSGVARASVWRLDAGARCLECVDALDTRSAHHASGETLCEADHPRFFAALAGVPAIAAPDAAEDARTAELAPGYLKAHDIASILAASVWEGGHWAGAFCLEHPERRAWTDTDVDFAGALAGLVTLVFASARREAVERERRESDRRHRRLFDHSPVPQWEVDLSGVFEELEGLLAAGITDLTAHFAEHPEDLERMAARRRLERVNDAAVKLYAAPSAEVLLEKLPELTMPATLDAFRDATVGWLEGRNWTRGEARHRTLDGRTLDVVLSAFMPVEEADGKRAVVSVVDFTDQRASERMLTDIAQQIAPHTGEAYFRSVVDFLSERLHADLALVGELTPDQDGVQTLAVCRDGESAQDFVYGLDGTPCQKVIGKRACLFPDRVAELFPDDAGLVRMRARAYAGAPLFASNGAPLGILVAAFREPLSDGSRVESIMRILAARVSAELERRQADEVRERLEAQLVHAQRLESVGRLAGGVAHDFNNLLAPIMAYAEMAKEAVPEADPVHEDLGEILVAAERASRLTRQLLAFSRRQQLQIRRLDLNDTVTNFAKMMSTVLREDIHFEVRLSQDLPCVSADQGQIEQVLMNLVLNAQDAMPTGGHLTVTTFAHDVGEGDELHPDLPPGSFVCMAVADTGTGMDPHTLAHLFEPFFTTKGPAEGTGLGLATAYGIMQQHGGGISVESEPESGSTFHVFVPVCAEAAHDEAQAPEGAARRSGSECILVVEDEAVVRRLVVTVLRRHGYDVVEAPDPVSALEIAKDPTATLDLLVTDVVMPEMDGVELHRRISQIRPELPVLFLSGYAHDVVASKGAAGMNLLAKPFSLKELTDRIRALLDD